MAAAFPPRQPCSDAAGAASVSKAFPKLEINVEAEAQGAPMRPPHGQSNAAPQTGYNSIKQFSQKLELYSGSVATVYQAVEIATGNRVVIKAYHKAKMQPKHMYKLEREIAAMLCMNGSFVVELYSTFSDADNIYLVMEFCEGGDLFKTMLKHGGRLDEHYVCVEIVAPLLRVLEKMHALKYMHRDIKPENIFLTRRGRLRLGDFGLAMNWDKELPFSRSGTLDYMAPEVLQNPSTQLQESPSVDMAVLDAKKIKPFSCAVDVWAAGVLAYELVSGRPPFEVEDEVKTVTHILYKHDIHFPTHYSPQWCDFVRCALIKDPRVRPSAAALMSHPWIANNLKVAIERAPSELHRRAKQELLSPLSLTCRPMRLPGTKAAQPAAAAPGGSRAMAMPLTPQPMRAAAAPDAARQAHYLHSHFSGGGAGQRADGAANHERSASPHAAPQPAMAGSHGHHHHKAVPSHAPLTVHQHQQQPSHHQQQHAHQQQVPATAPNGLYRPSPLSRTNSTPTKSHGAAPVAQLSPVPPMGLSRQGSLPSQQQPRTPQRHAHPHAHHPHPGGMDAAAQPRAHAGGGAPSEAVVHALQRKLQALHQAAAAEDMSTAEMTAMLTSAACDAGAHGAVHVTRAPPPASNASLLAPVQPAKAGYSLEATPPATPSRPSDKQTPLIKRLFVPGSPATPESPSPQAPTPGPAGPGIKERIKFHLTRQAGAV